eukprot:1180704-Prorocentrum_minimum.AAC.3
MLREVNSKTGRQRARYSCYKKTSLSLREPYTTIMHVCTSVRLTHLSQRPTEISRQLSSRVPRKRRLAFEAQLKNQESY